MSSRPMRVRAWPGPRSWISGPKPVLRPNQARAAVAALEALERSGTHRLLRQRRGIILADDVGMGKTREALAAALLFLARNRGDVTILVPPALRHKWRDEIREFVSAVLRLRGSRDVHAVARLLRNNDSLVVSVHEISRFVRRRLARKAKLIIVDEAHKARNRQTVLFRRLDRLVRRRNPRCALLLLTATPFQCDHHRELVNLLSLVDAGYDGPEKPRAGKGFDSITGAIEFGLDQLRRRLRDLVQEGEAPGRALEKLKTELDHNLDLEVDPHRKTFGVASGHDGFDEYLRSLVVRETKNQPKARQERVVVQPDDASLYLLGRAYLRAQRSAGKAGFDPLGDPPPGTGFLANGYSRLCSTYAAQRPTRDVVKDAHGEILRRRARNERGMDRVWSHPKLEGLASELASRAVSDASALGKVVVFANHVATVSQLRDSVGRLKQLKRLSARVGREKPLVSDRRAVARLLTRGGWNAMSADLGDVLNVPERRQLHAALIRHLALIKKENRRDHWFYLKQSMESVLRDTLQTPRRARRAIRRQLTGEHSGRSTISSSLRVRTFRPVEALWGDTDMLRRHRLIAAFNSRGVPPFVLIVSQAGSEGQNMHGACRRVVHFDLHWNPTVIHQRTGRVYRDQVPARDVRVTELIYPGGYDETIKDYARRRDAYRDFLLGERTLAQFLRDQDVTRAFSGSWRIDLKPDAVKLG